MCAVSTNKEVEINGDFPWSVMIGLSGAMVSWILRMIFLRYQSLLKPCSVVPKVGASQFVVEV